MATSWALLGTVLAIGVLALGRLAVEQEQKEVSDNYPPSDRPREK